MPGLWPVDGREQSFTIRLPRVSNPKSIREKGTATATMTVESIDTVETPAGTFQAVRVRIDFRSDLSAANAHRVTERWYTKEHGLIAEQFRETVKAFGLTVEQNERAIVLVETDH